MSLEIAVSVPEPPTINVTVEPGGAQGPPGADSTVPGPTAVSADDGNIAILGSDDLIFVPESGGGGAVDSVNGQTGVVVLDASDVGLGNVDNTADADKPVSTATATALGGKAATSHTHAESDVTGLTAALAGKSDTGHTHAESDVTGLTAALAGKSDTGHTHTASNVTDFNTAADARVVAGITGKLDTSAAPELIRDTIGTALVEGTNITITVDDGGDTITIDAAGGGPVAADYTKTTASLADLANEAGTFTFSASQIHDALVVSADRAARVRFYATTAQRDADVSRAIGTSPTGDHGLLLEVVLTSGVLSYTVTQSAVLFEQASFGAVPVNVTNRSGSTSTVLVTVKAKGL